MKRDETISYAQEIVEILRPACVEIQIAGSIRRQKEDVKDVEIVALPKWDLDMFDEPQDTTGELDAAINAAIRNHDLAWDEQVKRNGPRYKRLTLMALGIPIDLFLADERNFGNTLAIRTGCGDFSKWIVTSRSKGGGMPDYLQQCGGRLFHKPSGEYLPCRTEGVFFELLRVCWYEPEKRTPELASRLWGAYADQPLEVAR